MNSVYITMMLSDIQDSKQPFSVTLTGKRSKTVNGLYKLQTHEILLHNKNFKNDNELVYTAVHEYAHHLQNEKHMHKKYDRVHGREFFKTLHALLCAAEKKGYYRICVDKSPELAALTGTIRTKYPPQSGAQLRELGQMLREAFVLCIAADIRVEDYVDRVLCFPRSFARNAQRAFAFYLDDRLAPKDMLRVAKIQNARRRKDAERAFLKNLISPHPQARPVFAAHSARQLELF